MHRTRSTLTSKTRSRVLLTLSLLAMACFGVVFGFIAYSVSVPKGSPKAQMNRTEAALTLLVTALESYKTDLGAYPPPGQDGLRLATKHLSRNVNYVPGDESLDAWGQPFVYVPAAAYGAPGTLDEGGAFLAPGTYQLYSVGMDGDPGADSIEKRYDNVTSWEADAPWRATYQRRHQKFFLEHGTRK